MINRRNYFRLKLQNPLCANMTISQVNSRNVKTGAAHVCIHDIGPGGLRFSSKLLFPVSSHITLQFHIKVFDRLLKINGHIVRGHEVNEGIYEYGVRFIAIDELNRTILIKIFNKMMVKLQKNIKLRSCRFCESSEAECQLANILVKA